MTTVMASSTCTGYAIVAGSKSGNLGGFIETISAAAIRDALAERPDVMSFWSHNTSEMLGRVSNGSLRLTRDARGLHFSLDLPATTTGRDVQELIRRRDVRSMSFGFKCLEDRWSLVDGVAHREVLKMMLYEISPVPLGAYDSTSVRLTD